MKINNRLIRFYAGLFLALLFAAQTGQKVHIYHEDHLHFAAFSGDLVPDNGAKEAVSERCIIDDFSFFPCLIDTPFVHSFYAQLLDIVLPLATQCNLSSAPLSFSLRAPPVL